MKQLKVAVMFVGLIVGLYLLCPLRFDSTAQAADEPTVTLTKTELQEIINAQVAAAQAGPAFKKVQGAFTPAPTKPTVEPAK